MTAELSARVYEDVAQLSLELLGDDCGVFHSLLTIQKIDEFRGYVSVRFLLFPHCVECEYVTELSYYSSDEMHVRVQKNAKEETEKYTFNMANVVSEAGLDTSPQDSFRYLASYWKWSSSPRWGIYPLNNLYVAYIKYDGGLLVPVRVTKPDMYYDEIPLEEEISTSFGRHTRYYGYRVFVEGSPFVQVLWERLDSTDEIFAALSVENFRRLLPKTAGSGWTFFEVDRAREKRVLDEFVSKLNL